jgi:hypothetical protein
MFSGKKEVFLVGLAGTVIGGLYDQTHVQGSALGLQWFSYQKPLQIGQKDDQFVYKMECNLLHFDKRQE